HHPDPHSFPTRRSSDLVCSKATQTTCTSDADCNNNRGTCVTNTCTTQNTCTGSDYTGEHTPLHFTFNTPVNLVEDLTKNPPKLRSEEHTSELQSRSELV